MNERPEKLVERVELAERWLDRARHQLESGDPGKSALTLLLAGAEVARAREESLAASGSSDAGSPQDAPRYALPLAALFLAAGVAALLLLPLPHLRAPLAKVGDGAPAVVRLEGGSGSVLKMVTAQAPTPQAPKVRVIVYAPRAAVSPPAAARALTEAARPPGPAPILKATAVAPHAPAGAVPAPAPVPAAPQPSAAQAPLLSEADVIDLVLAAERSLRRSAGQ